MIERNIAFGYREETRQPGLRGEQVVVVCIDPAGRDIVADKEQPPFFVVEPTEIHQARKFGRLGS